MTTLSPPASSSSMMSAFPAATNKVVLVDTGSANALGSTNSNTLFSWATSAWVQDSTATFDQHGPLATRSNGIFCYDGTAMQLFSGASANATPGVIADQWALSSSLAWTKSTLATSALPSARFGAAAAYLAGTGLVMFGGANSSQTPIADKGYWVWNGTAWTLHSVVTNGSNLPGARHNHAMAASGSLLLLVGGSTTNEAASNAIWSFNGTTWSKVVPVGTAPAGRFGHRLVWDIAASLFVLFGGNNQSNGLPPEVWTTATGSSWTKVSVANGSFPPNWMNAQACYDAGSGHTLIWGGTNMSRGTASSETWSFNATSGVFTKLTGTV
jgi:hypothetical protein